MALAMRRPDDEDGLPDQQFRRFEALFSAELDELREHANDRGVKLEAVAEAYFVIVNGDRPMVTHSDLQDHLGRAGPAAWNIASVLVDFGEVHRSKGSDWWWIVASTLLAEKCNQRSISLKTYIEMQPDLQPFQQAVTRWYQTRQMHGNLQTRTMREIKVEYGKKLQEKYYPDKPFKNYIGSGDEAPEDRPVEEDDNGLYWTAKTPGEVENFHDHQIARYVKTAQDVIVEALDLSY